MQNCWRVLGRRVTRSNSFYKGNCQHCQELEPLGPERLVRGHLSLPDEEGLDCSQTDVRKGQISGVITVGFSACGTW